MCGRVCSPRRSVCMLVAPPLPCLFFFASSAASCMHVMYSFFKILGLLAIPGNIDELLFRMEWYGEVQ